MKMRPVLFSAALIVAASGLFIPAAGNAEVNVSITVPLPGLVLPAPPGLVVVPGTYVYYPPEVDVDIFFYHGYWYRPYRGGWYIANGYNGPWRSIGPRRVPGPLLGLPRTYRHVSRRHEHVPYPVVERNWRQWERERYWDDRRYERDRGRSRGRDGDEGKGNGRGHGRGRGDGRHRD
jgi:hypothetical protein